MGSQHSDPQQRPPVSPPKRTCIQLVLHDNETGSTVNSEQAGVALFTLVLPWPFVELLATHHAQVMSHHSEITCNASCTRTRVGTTCTVARVTHSIVTAALHASKCKGSKRLSPAAAGGPPGALLLASPLQKSCLLSQRQTLTRLSMTHTLN